MKQKKTTNKEIVVNNFAVLTLTFTDSSNTPQTDVSVILKDSTKKVLSENSGVEEIKYFLRPGTYFVDASVGDARVEDVQITVSTGANTRKIVFAAEETRSKDHSKDDRRHANSRIACEAPFRN